LSLTKAALAEAKKRGKKLGSFRGKAITPEARAASLRTRQERSKAKARDLAPIIEELKAAGATSLRQIAAGLNAKGIKTARGGEWSAGQVQRLLEPAVSA
jgi:DNA invertase Pin-like site-specific DNA recombinase